MTHHIVSPKVYFLIFAALLVLTIVTIAVASMDLGPVNTAVALSIAVCKATLVALYFMHVRHSTRLTQVFVVAGFLCLAILIGLIMSDFLTRERPSAREPVEISAILMPQRGQPIR